MLHAGQKQDWEDELIVTAHNYPLFILKIWQTMTNVDLHKSTSDFEFAKEKKTVILSPSQHTS